MIRLRYLILIVTTVVVTIVPTVMEGAQAIVYGVIGAGLVYTTLLALALRYAPLATRPVQAVASVAGDTILVSVVVWATGGVTSTAAGVYIAIGIAAAVYGGLRGAILGTIFYSACFAIAAALAVGVIPTWVGIYIHFLLRVTFAAAVSVFAGLLVREADTLASSNAELQRLNHLLHLRSTLSEIINATAEPTDLLLLVAKRLREELALTRAQVIVTRVTARVLAGASHDDTIIVADPIEVGSLDPIIGQALSERRLIAAAATAAAPGRALCLPLISDDRVLGALYLADTRTIAPFDPDDVREVAGAVGQVAVKLDNLRLLIDLNRSYVELRQVDHLKTTILANTSHELRTPLTLILGYAEALTGGLGGQLSPEQATFAGGIRQNGKRLQALVENLLAVASMEKGPIAVHPQALDAERQIDHVVTALQPAFAAKDLTLVRPTAGSGLAVQADAQALRQVLTHLLKNAIEFSPRGTTITVDVVPDSDPALLQLRVIDRGVGMTTEQVATIFTMFHQLDGTARRAHEGAGLGLYISKRLVEAQGGRIGVVSSPGQGSTFTVTLPRATSTGQIAAVDRPAVAAGQ
ncbi:MAG: HAMP domain-containing histidine kinase [Chloroflexi bacterium]|nr:HAMP domain-containing histidine kinase [Chloroflexota bacterium]